MNTQYFRTFNVFSDFQYSAFPNQLQLLVHSCRVSNGVFNRVFIVRWVAVQFNDCLHVFLVVVEQHRPEKLKVRKSETQALPELTRVLTEISVDIVSPFSILVQRSRRDHCEIFSSKSLSCPKLPASEGEVKSVYLIMSYHSTRSIHIIHIIHTAYTHNTHDFN